MIRAFLSHSSKDKGRYVKIVAEKLGVSCVYDEYSFEEGMRPLEEIISGLDASQLFAVFLSSDSLDSEWVRSELFLANQRLSQNQLERIFPIIIDPMITHDDSRIPAWLREGYNLKLINRPVVAARRIRQRLREISWGKDPSQKERDGIFVGRNELIRNFENRLDNFDVERPVALFASGLPKIGRSSLLRHAFIKCNIVRQSYEFASVFLSREDGIEDFILQLCGLGISAREYPKNLLSMRMEERIDLAKDICREIRTAKEYVLVHDSGCLVTNELILRPWFDELLKSLATDELPVFIVASRYRLRPDYARDRPFLFSLAVPELSVPERNGLFRRLIDFYSLPLKKEEFDFFCGLFQGFPDQIQFTCNLIQDHGVGGAAKRSDQVAEFSVDKAAAILARYGERDKEELIDFLYLLSRFEFISFDFLYSIVEGAEYASLVDELLADSVCDYVGADRDFIRLNDVIRDYASRNRVALPDKYRAPLELHLNKFLSDEDVSDRDISDIFYSIKEGIKSGKSVPTDYLIPSHFLSSIRELYQQKGHLDRVIELCDMLLEKRHLLEGVVEADVRYYLCLALARKKDERFLKEVSAINGPEHSFLLGFYYRLKGRFQDAIDRFNSCVNQPAVAKRVKRELVQAYLSTEEFELASALARSNYEEHRSNVFHIQAYFNTTINSNLGRANRDLLMRLVDELRAIETDLAKEMADNCYAELLFKCDGNYSGSCDAIDDAIARYPDSHYPILTKAFLAAKNRDLGRLKAAYGAIDRMSKSRGISDESLVRLKAYIKVLEGDLDGAIALAQKGLARMPVRAREHFIEILRDMSLSSH